MNMREGEAMASRVPDRFAANGPHAVEFSFTITCYNEEDSIEEFNSRLSSAVRALGRTFEIIYVNDGSDDRTFEKLKAIYEKTDEVFAIVDLFRNVGQMNALTAGITLMRGRHLVVLDSDLQLDPEDFPLLVEEFDKGYDMVSGHRVQRNDPLFRRLASVAVNGLIRMLMPYTPSDFGCTFKIFEGKIVRAFNYGPYSPFRPAEFMDSFQRCSEVPVKHHARRYNSSGWRLSRLIAYAVDNLLGITPRPFQFLAAGFLLAAVALITAIVVMLATGWLPEQGHASMFHILLIMLINLFITTGLLMGVNEFVIRNHMLLRQRPAYIVREEYRRDQDD